MLGALVNNGCKMLTFFIWTGIYKKQKIQNVKNAQITVNLANWDSFCPLMSFFIPMCLPLEDSTKVFSVVLG